VISEATYGPSEPDEEGKGLIVDVTIAVQALVHNSQVYVAGHRSKVRESSSYLSHTLKVTTNDMVVIVHS